MAAGGAQTEKVVARSQQVFTRQRPRNPELTKRDILIAAREEFSENGLDGARVDRIAERAAANKRLLYHYFGNKESLYSAVLLEAYQEIREGELKLKLGDLPPKDAMAKLVKFTFDHFKRNPWFIRLLSTENILRAEYIRRISRIRSLNSPIVDLLRCTLERGQKKGVFRESVDPVQLYVSIASLSYFYFSNIHTLSVIFDVPLQSKGHRVARRQHAVDMILGYLRPEGGAANRTCWQPARESTSVDRSE